MPDTTNTVAPARDKLDTLIAEYLRLSDEIDTAAAAALHEHTARHYPDAVTLVLDSNGNPDEYTVVDLLTGDGTAAGGDCAALDDLVRNLPKFALRYDRTSGNWHVALREG